MRMWATTGRRSSDHGDPARRSDARRADGARSPFPPRTMIPVSESRFFDKLGNEYTFRRAADGRVADLVVQWSMSTPQIRHERMQ